MEACTSLKTKQWRIVGKHIGTSEVGITDCFVLKSNCVNNSYRKSVKNKILPNLSIYNYLFVYSFYVNIKPTDFFGFKC